MWGWPSHLQHTHTRKHAHTLNCNTHTRTLDRLSHLQGVSVLEAVGDELSLRHVIQPVELATAVLATVECGEALKTALQLRTNNANHA